MIEVFDEEIKNLKRKSSKGNQLKWRAGDFWYKADNTGYEGLAEYMVSKALQASSLGEDQFARYETEQIRYKKNLFRGAKSKNFLEEGWQLVTLERLFQNKYSESLTKAVWNISDTGQRLRFLVDQIVGITGLKDFGIYMSQMMTVDAFFLNEDRHLHNIAVMMNENGTFAYCPLFDHGAALLSDTTLDYPMGEDTVALMSQVKAKTYVTDFEEALDVAEQLYGCHLKFMFEKKDVEVWIAAEKYYSEDEKRRVLEIFYQQIRKYAYLMN